MNVWTNTATNPTVGNVREAGEGGELNMVGRRKTKTKRVTRSGVNLPKAVTT